MEEEAGVRESVVATATREAEEEVVQEEPRVLRGDDISDAPQSEM